MSYNIGEVEVNKTVTITQNVSTTGTVSQNVQLSFMPDFMVVKQISYAVEGTETVNTVRDVVFNLTGDIIGSFLIVPFITNPAAVTPTVQNPVNPNSYIRIRQPIQGDMSFTILSNGGQSSDMHNGRISISLDFIRFKVSPVQKVY
jgi:hypothetical protein